MSAIVPTKVEFDALKATVTQAVANIADLDRRLAVLETPPVVIPPVVPPVVPPIVPPIISPGLWPNEPAGFRVLTETPLSALSGSGWQQVQRQTTNGSGLFLVDDPSAPLSPPSVLEFRYAPGFQGGSEPGVAFYAPPPAPEVYLAFLWKPSNPWQNHQASGVNKLAFFFTPSNGPILIEMHAEGAQYFLHVVPEFSGDTRRLTPNRAKTPITLGQWHLVEWYLKYGANRTGITRWALDGVPQGEYTDLGTPTDAGVIEVQLAPTWGGIGETKAELDTYRYDHARISVP